MKLHFVMLFCASLGACSAPNTDADIDNKISSNPELQKIADSVRNNEILSSDVPVKFRDIAMFSDSTGDAMSCVVVYGRDTLSGDEGNFVFMGNKDEKGIWQSVLTGPKEMILNNSDCDAYAKSMNSAHK